MSFAVSSLASDWLTVGITDLNIGLIMQNYRY